MNPKTTLLVGDCRRQLEILPDETIHTVVTSPPYWGLRDYGVPGQIGLEADIETFLDTMVHGVFGQVRRVLRSDGTAWVNLGDTYRGKQLLGLPWRFALAMQAAGWKLRADIIWHKPNPVPEPDRGRPTVAHEYLFLFAKSDRYFYDADAIREPSEDAKLTPSNADAEPSMADFMAWEAYVFGKGKNQGADADRLGAGYRKTSPTLTHPAGRNKRSVWTIPTEGFKGAHFASYPRKLVEPCILAGTSAHGACSVCGAPWQRVTEYTEAYKQRLGKSWHDHQDDLGRGQRGAPPAFRGGPTRVTTGWTPGCQCDAPPVPCRVLDPFGGTGTTAHVANALGRDAVLVELNPAYVPYIQERTAQQRLALLG